jgi:hypothetical protein
MLLSEEIGRIKKLMNIKEGNIFKKFNLFDFKNEPPPSDNSTETKKEINFLKKIDLKKRFAASFESKPSHISSENIKTKTKAQKLMDFCVLN